MESSQSRTPTPHSPLPTPRSERSEATQSEAAIFVYGSLKRGLSNHERYCRGVLEVREATVRGRLYELPFGFPGLVVPEADVRAVGTADYLSDALVQQRASSGPRAPTSGWDTVHGELMTFGDPEERLPALDILEGYAPGEEGLYERVLIPVEVATGVVLAWAYRIERAAGVYLPDGRWPAS
jgi:gamma-glutamylcyclotransferase (GGCT)/AIG2-like uncharacterized protein YtfP